MKSRYFKPFLSVAILLISALACNLPSSSGAGKGDNPIAQPTATFDTSFPLPTTELATSRPTITSIPTSTNTTPPTKIPSSKTPSPTSTPTPTYTPTKTDTPIPDQYNASISGSVFNDLNENGVRDQGELGLFDQTVLLRFGACDLPLNVNKSTKTAPFTGSYNFKKVGAGSYCVSTVIKKACNGRSQDILVQAPVSINVSLSGENKSIPAFGASCSLLIAP